MTAQELAVKKHHERTAVVTKGAKVLTDEETKQAVYALKCDGLKRLGRLLELPKAFTLRKTELRQQILNILLKNPAHHFRDLKCLNWVKGCDWNKIFEEQVRTDYEQEKKAKDTIYQDRGATVGKTKSTLYAACDSFQNIQVINVEKDEYEFIINDVVHLVVRPNKTVEIPAKGTSAGKEEEVAAVMSWVLRRALSWSDPVLQEQEAKTDAPIMALRGTPAVEIIFDTGNDVLEMEFRHPTKQFSIPPLYLSTTGERQTLKRAWASLALLLDTTAAKQPTQAPVSLTVDDYGITFTLDPGWEMRYRGTLLMSLGWYKENEWSDWQTSAAIGYLTQDDEEQRQINASKVAIRKLATRSHLEVFSGFSKTGDEPLEIVWLPGAILVGGTGPEEKRRLIQSSIKLGMEWKPSDPITKERPYLFPNPISGVLQTRPVYGSGNDDCPQGFVRDGQYGCCVYLLQGALETFEVSSLEACVNEECKGVSKEQARELKDYLQGVKEGDASLREYVTSLNLTPDQLQWTLDMAKQMKNQMLKQLGAALDGMMEDAGIPTPVDDCSVEEILEMSKGGKGTKLLTESKSWTAKATSGSWWALKSTAEAAWTLAQKLGQALVWALKWLFKIAFWLLRKLGQVVYYVTSTGLQLASKGMQLAAWILSDPRRARLILVLVRRLRITMCKRAGLYLIQNKYAVPISEKRAAEIVKQSENPTAFASEILEDVTELTRSELSGANLAGTVFNSSVGQKAVGIAGKIVKAGLMGFLNSIPIIGGVVAGVGEVIADEVGDKLSSATKEALEIQRLQTNIFDSLKLLRDIFNVDECLHQAGFELTVDWPGLLEKLVNDPKETFVSAYDQFKKSYLATAVEPTITQSAAPPALADDSSAAAPE